jgi:hypothetical protein
MCVPEIFKFKSGKVCRMRCVVDEQYELASAPAVFKIVEHTMRRFILSRTHQSTAQFQTYTTIRYPFHDRLKGDLVYNKYNFPFPAQEAAETIIH